MKALFILVLFILNLKAFETLKIKDENVDINTIGYTYFVKESKDLKTAKDILKNSDILKLSKNNYLGIKAGPYWTLFSIKNETDKSLDLIISSEHSGVNYLDVYIFNNGLIEKEYYLGDMRDQKDREILHHKSVFNLNIYPNETKIIIARFDNPGMYKINWSIKDSINFINNDNKYILYLLILSSLIFFISINSLILYKIYKTRTFFIIFIEATFVFLYVLSLYGYLYQLNIGIPLFVITLLAWCSIFIVTISRIIFPIFFFDLKNKYPKIFVLLLILIFLFISQLGLILYNLYFEVEQIGKFESLIYLSFTLYTFVLLFCAIYLIIKKEKYSRAYMIMQLIVTVISSIHTLNIIGILNIEFINPYLIHAIIVLDSLFILIIQYFNSKNNYKEQVKQNNMLLEQARFYSVGQSIGHISHQWKHPLSRISATITALEFIMKNDKNQVVDFIDKKLEIIKNSISEMKYTVDNFSNIFSTNMNKSNFSLKKCIEENVISILESKIITKNVNIHIDIATDFKINSYEHVISNIFMILIDNSLDAFEKIETKNNIKISATNEKNRFKIIYEDNAGGIKIKPIEKVFEYFVSSKNDNSGSGIGLALLKILITEKLNGKVTVRNIENGSIFELFLIK